MPEENIADYKKTLNAILNIMQKMDSKLDDKLDEFTDQVACNLKDQTFLLQYYQRAIENMEARLAMMTKLNIEMAEIITHKKPGELTEEYEAHYQMVLADIHKRRKKAEKQYEEEEEDED